jgi:hypothetical protein
MSAALKPRFTHQRQQPQNDRHRNNCSAKPHALALSLLIFDLISDFSVIVISHAW